MVALQVSVLAGVWPTDGRCLSGLLCVRESSTGWRGEAPSLEAIKVAMFSFLPDVLGDFSPSSMMRCMLVDWVTVSVRRQEADDEDIAGNCGTCAVSSWEVCGLRVEGGGQSSVSRNS